MKPFFVFLWAMLCLAGGLYAQTPANTCRKDLPEVLIGPDVSLHFISPEPITYVDISTHALAGDLPVKNVLRLKMLPDSALRDGDAAILTIVGESFIAQYNLRYIEGAPQSAIPTQVNILPEHTRPLDVPGITLTTKQMRDGALRILDEPETKAVRKAKAYGMQARLNHVYTAGDHIFLDISYGNRTNLPYEIDEQRFKIEDKKINKATNVQSVEIRPIWQLYPNASFKRRYRNIYVLEKVTFPGNKVLNIELSEKQLSGRTVTLQIRYSDILEADHF